MITWREWKNGEFGKKHKTKVAQVYANIYYDDFRNNYVITESYLTSANIDGTMTDVKVQRMSDDVLIGCV